MQKQWVASKEFKDRCSNSKRKLHQSRLNYLHSIHNSNMLFSPSQGPSTVLTKAIGLNLLSNGLKTIPSSLQKSNLTKKYGIHMLTLIKTNFALISSKKSIAALNWQRVKLFYQLFPYLENKKSVKIAKASPTQKQQLKWSITTISFINKPERYVSLIRSRKNNSIKTVKEEWSRIIKSKQRERSWKSL